MKYIYIDGDNIGLKIEQSFLNNDEEKLSITNLEVINAVSQISSYLGNKKQQIIFAGADGIIAKGQELEICELLQFVRNVQPSLTFSIGIGVNLKDCYMALRYAKSFGKNIAVDHSDKSGFIVIEK
ncbi:mCpol domain-containing protein [Niastella sp. OAS944]|uniref:mCpol domain-containing protein n=1 Tax=Niastella sp. OAS944 TaxID=2664089 RepID=UPI003485660F|nr:GTP cyclohydrolase III [Chitinophagaceae bacterium OAS944]